MYALRYLGESPSAPARLSILAIDITTYGAGIIYADFFQRATRGPSLDAALSLAAFLGDGPGVEDGPSPT